MIFGTISNDVCSNFWARTKTSSHNSSSSGATFRIILNFEATIQNHIKFQVDQGEKMSVLRYNWKSIPSWSVNIARLIFEIRECIRIDASSAPPKFQLFTREHPSDQANEESKISQHLPHWKQYWTISSLSWLRRCESNLYLRNRSNQDIVPSDLERVDHGGLSHEKFVHLLDFVTFLLRNLFACV